MWRGLCLAAAVSSALLVAQNKPDLLGYAESRWGMTEAQVTAAFEGRTVPLPESARERGENTSLWLPDLEIMTVKYAARFHFKDGALIAVSVSPMEPHPYSFPVEFGQLLQMLTTKYGPPSWRDLHYPRRVLDLREYKWFFPTTTVWLLMSNPVSRQFAEEGKAAGMPPRLTVTYTSSRRDADKL